MRVEVSLACGQGGVVQRWTVNSCPDRQGEKWLPRRMFVLESRADPREVTRQEAAQDPRFLNSDERRLSYDEIVALLIQYPRFFFLDERESLRFIARDQAQNDALGRATDVLIQVQPSYEF